MFIRTLTKTLFLIILFSAYSHASAIKVDATGNTAYISALLAPFFAPGEELSISFELDLEVNDSATNNNNFAWYNYSQEMSFSIGSVKGSVPFFKGSVTNGPFEITEDDGTKSCICSDVWAVEGKNAYGSTFDFPIIDDFYLDIVQLEFRDEAGDAIRSDDLFTGMDNLSSFDQGWIAFYFKSRLDANAQTYTIRSNVPELSITKSEVPEPGLVAILMLSALPLLTGRAKALRSSRRA